MSVIDIQRIVTLVAFIFIGLWSFRVGCKSRWVQIRGGMHTISAISVVWILFTIAATGTAAFIKTDVHLDELYFSIWLLTIVEVCTVAGLGLLIYFGKSLSDTQDRVIDRMRAKGVELDD